MNGFFGREQEIRELKAFYRSNRMETVLVHGRKGVGKTSLILQSLKDFSGTVIYYEWKTCSLKTNLEMFGKLFGEKLGFSGLLFKDLLGFLGFAFSVSENKDIVLALDDFQNLSDKSFAIDSFFDTIHHFKGKTRMKLVISGNDVGWIRTWRERTDIFDTRIFLRPFDYQEAANFYPDYSNEDKWIAYAVFGGMPCFIHWIDPSKSVQWNIENLAIRPNSPLEADLNGMIGEETSRVDNFNDAARLLAHGKAKQSDLIADLKGFEKSEPRYLLSKMQAMGVLEKGTPINDKNNRKKTFLRFQDNFFAFYYRYIGMNPYSAMRENPKKFYIQFIKEDFRKNYLPKKFEDVSREFLFKESFLGKIKPAMLDIGTYFPDDGKDKKDCPFDVVTRDERGYVFYECLYHDSIIGNDVIAEKIKRVESLGIDFYRLGFLAKKGFAKDVDKEKYRCYTLDDFYK